MFMPLMCVRCVEEATKNAGDIPVEGLPIPMTQVPLQTSGLYRGKCRNGHDVLMYADFQPFELLFQSGLEALVDGYFRESVGSFAAALERFYEFSIATFVLAQGGDHEGFLRMWKAVSNQSERQLGMFIGLYTAYRSSLPKLLADGSVKFRNQVIHKGHFPTPEKTFAFAEEVYGLITAGVKELRANYPEPMQAAREIARREATRELKPGENPGSFGMGTAISLLVVDEPRPLGVVANQVRADLSRHRIAAA